MRWLKLPSKLVANSSKSVNTPERNSLALKHYQITWTAREASDMFASIGKTRVYADLPLGRRRSCLQSTIVDFDLADNILVLEPFFPRVALPELYRVGPFELTLRELQTPLKLLCLAIGQDGRESVPLYLKILEKGLFVAHQQYRTVAFNSSCAPAIEIFMPLCGASKGNVARISERAVTLTVFDLPLVPARGSVGTCIIHFTEQFQLRAALRVKAVKIQRKPHRHFVIHAEFENEDEVLREKLQTFLTMVDPAGNGVPTACTASCL